jgi:dTDP-4-amino-4,6-dideoxygalactose transaminase
MKVPLLDLKAQLEPLREDILKAITEVVDSTRYIMGPKVEQFEAAVAAYSGARAGVGVSSGTDALLVSLMALGVEANDRVITTPFSFFATAGAISRVGGRPVFVDIDPVTFNISPEKLGEFFHTEKQGNSIRAAIPVHLYGQTADMDPIVQMCGLRSVSIIEDAAQAIGAQYPSVKGLKSAGSLGDAGCFSFFPSKNLGGMGDAGMVVTQDEKLAEKLRLLINHGAHPKYYHKHIGGNFRMDPLQAAVLQVKLAHLDSWSSARRRNADYYDELFSGSGLTERGAVSTPVRVWENKGLERPHIFNQYVIRVKDGCRDGLREHLSQAGIGVEIYYPVPFHLQECFRHLGYRKGDFPEAEKAAGEVLALPVYPELTREMQEFVVESIAQFFRSQG